MHKKVILKLVIMMEIKHNSSNCTKQFLQNADADLRSIYAKICSFMPRYGKLCLNFQSQKILINEHFFERQKML